MNVKSIIASAAMFLSLTTFASAEPFSDVPASHWAYDAVKSMADDGIIQGFPDSTFKGNTNVTRYQMAMMIAQALAKISETGGKLSVPNLKNVEKLTTEFADELALLGVKVTSLEDDMQVLKNDVSEIKSDVDNIKSNFKNGKIEKIKLSGDIMIRNYNSESKNVAKYNRTGTKLRLQLDAQIDENVKAVARWRMTDFNNNDLGPAGFAGAAWNGTNHVTGNIDTAYLEIKDMFRFHGDFIFGRRFMTHGHALVVNEFMDAISYIKRCGDVDLSLNTFFNRQGNEDYRNMWNINADTKYRGHDLYFGLYYTSYDKDYMNNIVTVAPYNQVPFNGSSKEYDLEVGSRGDLGDNGYWSYDFGTVYQQIDKAKFNANTNTRSDRKGFILHGAINWDSKTEWAGKLAYTMVDDEANMGTKVSYDERCLDSTENPLEDVLRDSKYAFVPLATPVYVSNLQDIKVQFDYTPKNKNKHYLRFAYDMVQPKDDAKNSTLFVAGAGNSDKADIFNAEYRYRLAENTRFRAGYTDFHYNDGNNSQDYNIYWAEIYSHF